MFFIKTMVKTFYDKAYFLSWLKRWSSLDECIYGSVSVLVLSKLDVLNVEVFFINQNQKYGMNFNQTTVPWYYATATSRRERLYCLHHTQNKFVYTSQEIDVVFISSPFLVICLLDKFQNVDTTMIWWIKRHAKK